MSTEARTISALVETSATLSATVERLESERDRLASRVAQLEQERPAWTPLMLALEEMAKVWDPELAAESSTDDLVMSGEDVVKAWQAYRQQRFGALLAPTETQT